MKNLPIPLSNILQSADDYDKEHLSWKREKLPELLSNTNSAVLHVLKTFMYRRRSDRLSKMYIECLENATNSLLRSREISFMEPMSGGIVERLIEEYENNVSKRIGKINKRDVEMIKTYFTNVHPELRYYDYNPIRYIKEVTEQEKLWKAYYLFTTRVKNTRDKLVGLLLRDVIDVLEYRGKLKERDLFFIFPIDTWVRTVTKMLAEEIWKVNFVKSDDNGIKYIAICKCLEYGIHPSDYNKGVWKLGSKYGTLERIREVLFTENLERYVKELGRGNLSSSP